MLAGIMRSNKSWGAYLQGVLVQYLEQRQEKVAIHNCRNYAFPNIQETENELRNKRNARYEHLLFKSKQHEGKLIGIEVEFYPSNETHRNMMEESRKNYLVTYGHDGSLRSGGMEFRKLTWRSNNGRLNGLLSVSKLLQDRGSVVDTSCGLHIHIDVRNLDNEQREETYDRVCEFYPFLKKLVPKSRLKNKYCQFVNNRPESENYQRPRNGERYAAINWCSVGRHGTIEFRLGSASTNLVKIESWSLLCQYIVNWCSNPENTIPQTWNEFLVILPKWLSSWCVLRHEKLYGNVTVMDDRVASAADSNSLKTNKQTHKQTHKHYVQATDCYWKNHKG